MMKLWKNSVLFLLFIGLSTIMMPLNAHAECQSGQPQQCGNANKCKPSQDGRTNGTGKKAIIKNSSSDSIKSDCLRKATEDSCFMAVPSSFSGSYNSIGNRRRCPGGKIYTGSNCPADKVYMSNHYGTDIGMGGRTNEYAYAAADGEVVWAKRAGGSGNTAVMNHPKRCTGSTSGTGSADNSYHTIYRHLYKFITTSGRLNKGEKLGIIGGSDYHSKTGKFCQHPSQQKMAGCEKLYSDFYPIHLHFEVVDGLFSASSDNTSTYTDDVMEPYCGNMQSLCGGCPTTASSCGKGMGSSSNSEAGTAQGGVDSTGGGGEAAAPTDGCNFSSYVNSEDCTFCELFKKLFNAASTMAQVANYGLSIPTKDIVSIGFVIWLAIYLLKQVASYSKIGTGEMLKGIFFQGFRVAVVLLALGGALYQIMDLTINPVMMTGLNFAQTLDKNSSCEEGKSYMQNIIGYDAATGYPKLKEGTDNTVGGLSRDIGKALVCNVKKLEDSTGFLMSLGKYSMCISWERYPWIRNVLPSLTYFSTGLVLWIIGLLLLLSFPWALVDCVLQLCIAVALLPCAVGAYAFKVTAQYLKTVWNLFMNAMFNFVFMAIIIYIINTHLMEWIGYKPGSTPNDEVFVTAFSSEGLAWWGIGTFKVFAIVLFCWSFFDEAGSMAKEFANGMSFHGLGGKIGGAVTSAAHKAGAAAGKVAWSGTKAAARGTYQAANSAFGNSLRNGLNRTRSGALKLLGGKTVPNPDGSTSVTRTFNVLGFKHTRTVTKGTDGIYTQLKETRQRTNAEKYFKTTVDQATGETKVRAHKTFMGMTLFGMLGSKEMVAHKDEATGRTVYETVDGGRKRRLVVGANGKELKFNTNVDGGGKDQNVYERGGVRSTNDAFMHTTETLNSKGEVIGRKTTFSNTTGKYITNADGTTNIHAYNQAINGADNKTMAHEAIVMTHLAQRGQAISDSFVSRQTVVNKDNSVTITQKNNDGTTQVINAKLVGDQMITSIQQFDKDNNPIKYQYSNGMQTKTEYYTQQNGKFNVTSQQSFSADIRRQSNQPLDENGNWGYGLNRDKIMTGFSDKDFQDHLQQLQNAQNSNGKKNYIRQEQLSKEEVLARMGVQHTATPQPQDKANELPQENPNGKPLESKQNETNKPVGDKPKEEGKPTKTPQQSGKPEIEKPNQRPLTDEEKAKIATEKEHQAKAEKKKAEEKKLQRDEEKKKAEEELRKAKEEERRLEEEKRRAEEVARKADELERQKAEEEARKAAEAAQKAETIRKEAEAKAQKAAEEAQKAEEARKLAENNARKATEEKERLEKERKNKEEADKKKKEGWRENAKEGNKEGDELRAEIDKLKDEVKRHNQEVAEIDAKMARGQMTVGQRTEAEQRQRLLNEEAEKQNAIIRELEARWNDWKKRGEAHNKHVADKEEVK